MKETAISTDTERFLNQMVISGKQTEKMIGSDRLLAMLAKGKISIVKNVGDQDIRLVCDLASDLPIDNGSLNLSMCGLGMHRLQVPRLVAEGPRVRKPGGKLGFEDLCTTLIWSSSSSKFFTGTIRHR